MRNILWAYGRLLRPLPPSMWPIVFRVRESFHKGAVQDPLDEAACAEYWGKVCAALLGSLELTRFAFVLDYDEGEVHHRSGPSVRPECTGGHLAEDGGEGCRSSRARSSIIDFEPDM